MKDCPRRNHKSEHDMLLSGRRILPPEIKGDESAADLIDQCFLAYNAGRLREALQLFTRKMLEPEVTVGISLAGALTPAGLGPSCIVPLIEAGFVDWIVSTGANLYHDLHFAFNYKLVAGDFRYDDRYLHEVGVVRIYDVLLSLDECLIETDRRVQEMLVRPEFQGRLTTAELHHYMGKYAAEAEEKAGLPHVSVLAAAYRCGVPVYTSSPGDSTIGMVAAAERFRDSQLVLDPLADVNETAAIYYWSKQEGRRSAVVIFGGGSPKNFVLQTAPHVTDILEIETKGHDYFLQFTDARPDTGGLSGATPQEAVSWGKVDPDRVPDSVVCYIDSTVAMPLLTSYALTRRSRRPLKRLFERREELVRQLRDEFLRRHGSSDQPTG
ncbi:homospermidine biosynthesis protein [Thermogutta sp.]|jgi:deoxyhypusine synthase|uniref:homospermidine biosynthesis protein n=1 Tax=Thermogutta sp. TaxID=1962930 RepID=UPI003C7C572D